jgi:uncharacterized membrane protein (DUF373 family)
MKLDNIYFYWLDYREKGRLVKHLEIIQDLIVTFLSFCLFVVMLMRLEELVVSLMHPLQFQTITSEILFLLILIELFRILIIYLQERRFSVGVALEASIVSVLREVILRGILEIPADQVWAISGFLIVLGIMTLLRTIDSSLLSRNNLKKQIIFSPHNE